MYYLLIVTSLFSITFSLACHEVKSLLYQKVEHEGFHRNILWSFHLQEPSPEEWDKTGCNISILIDATPGMYIYPNELEGLNRLNLLQARVLGDVDVEAPAHESTGHTAFVYLHPSKTNEGINIIFPFHLRYQRAQLSGGYGKVALKVPSVIATCGKDSTKICGDGKLIDGPCDIFSSRNCTWKTVKYERSFEESELHIPVGNLDDYPIISVFTLLLGCFGCLYVLSIISSGSGQMFY